MITLTWAGQAGLVWVALTLVLLCIKRTRKTALAMGAALLITLLVCNIILKPLIARPRPCWLNPNGCTLIPTPKDFSFPSGHAMSSFAAAWPLRCLNKKTGALALLFAGLIAFSRMYLYVHYLTDVLAGAFFGLGAGMLGVFVVSREFEDT